jgi:uroporphyrinogen decarboxylase
MANEATKSSVESADWSALPLREKQTIVTRFEEKISQAQKNSPPTRDWVRKAIRRQGAARCPVRLKRLSLDAILQYGDRLADLFCKFPDDVIHAQTCDFSIGYQPPDRPDRVNELKVLTESAEWTDEWGTRWGHRPGGVGATPVDVPIKDWSQLDDYLAHRIPNPNDPGRLANVQPLLSLHGERKYCVGVVHLMLFERLHCLRGMGNTFVDLAINEREVSRLCGALADYAMALVHRWCETPVSGIFLADDWGSQTGLMISLDMWRKFFKPHYRRIFDEIHRLDRDIIFHSCGNVMGIVPELIDLGVDVLDPVQPGAMKIEDVARQFGGKISFCGGIDDQRLEAYSPEEVRDVVRQAVGTLGSPFGNGYIGAPANLIPPTVPFESLEVLIEAFHEG